MSLDKKSKLALFAENFSVRYHRKMKVVRQMQTLQELQVISELGATISRSAKESGKAPEEMDYEEVSAALSQYKEPSFGQGDEIYERMSDHLKDMVWGYASNHFHYAPVKEDIDSLAISGGGGKGLFYLSALEHLEDEGVMDQIRTVAGTSAGALTAIPLALGCNTKDLKAMIDSTDFREFFIEGAEFGSKSINLKRLSKDMKVLVGDSEYDEREKIVNFLAKIKDIVNFGYEGQDNNSKIKSFLTKELDKPVSKNFLLNAEHSLVVERLWRSSKVRDFCSDLQQAANRSAEYDYIKDPKKVLDIAVCFYRNNDFIEHYFAKLIKERVDLFAKQYGNAKLSQILPHLKKTQRESLTLDDIGKLANTPEGASFGFRDLAIGITKTNLGKQSDILSNILSNVLGTEGVIVSSQLEKSDNKELSQTPIKSLARLSMSIPFAFQSKHQRDSFYVDGGLHNNLPTEYFDRYGYSRKTLSIVPMTGAEIHAATTVPDALRSGSPYDFHGARGKNVFESILHHAKESALKPLGKAQSMIMLNGNVAYQKMGFKESFRTMIINTGDNGTFTFRVEDDEYQKVASRNEGSFKGESPEKSIIDAPPSFFDDRNNNLLKLYEHKLINAQSRDADLYQEAIEHFMAKNKEKIQKDPFKSLKGNVNIQAFMDRVGRTDSTQLDF